MMRAGYWNANFCIPPGHYGTRRRSFFMPQAKCQALVLGCQARDLSTMLHVIGCRFKIFASTLGHQALSWWSI